MLGPCCATIDITRQDLAFADVGLEVYPFTGKVNVDDSGPFTVYTLAIDPREVRIEFREFVVFLVDLLVQMFTGYDSLEDDLMDIIDCQAIWNLVSGICPSWLCSQQAVIDACEDLKPSAYALLEDLLNQIGVGWKLLRFDGWANIDTESDPPYATELGYSNHEESGDGHWEGTFDIGVGGDITGSWHGER